MHNLKTVLYSWVNAGCTCKHINVGYDVEEYGAKVYSISLLTQQTNCAEANVNLGEMDTEEGKVTSSKCFCLPCQ